MGYLYSDKYIMYVTAAYTFVRETCRPSEHQNLFLHFQFPTFSSASCFSSVFHLIVLLSLTPLSSQPFPSGSISLSPLLLFLNPTFFYFTSSFVLFSLPLIRYSIAHNSLPQYVWQNDSFLLLLYLIMIKFLLCSTLASWNSFSAFFSHSQQLCKKFFKKKIVLLPNFYTFKAYQGIAPFKIISLIHVIFQK